MSERMTAITLPGLDQGAGYADWGVVAKSDMIARLREMAAKAKSDSEAILAAADEDFRIERYVGVYVQRERVVLQEGRKVPA